MTTMVALVGEQPIPNLLPARYLKPERVVLVHTKHTEDQTRRLRNLLSDTETQPLKIEDAYNIASIRDKIQQEMMSSGGDFLFNLTGGTKTMVLAAYDLARQFRSPFLYLQTEGRRGRDQQSVLYRYYWQDDTATLEDRIVLDQDPIRLDDYLWAHFDGYEENSSSKEKGGELEKAVYDALRGCVDEIKRGVRPAGLKEQVEIDLVIRCGNQVGFIEVKSGGSGSGKHAVDQLTTAAARELTGTYAARFLVTGETRDEQYKAIAGALNISVIELVDWHGGLRKLSDGDVQRLRQRIAERLPCRS